MGDIHFSQGDGEISFCGAIEMSGFIDLHVDIIKGGVAKYGMINPIFKPGPVEPHHSEYLIFEGISVDEKGKQYYLDAHVAYRRACLNAIEYLKKFGFTGEQAYLMLGAAPCEGRISGIVDIPNACCTLAADVDLRLRHHAVVGRPGEAYHGRHPDAALPGQMSVVRKSGCRFS